MLGKRPHHRSLGIALLVILALLVVSPAEPAEAPPLELRYVCVDAQDNVAYAADPASCARGEELRALPDDGPIQWCADHLGRLKELAECSSRDRAITVPDDGPIFVCARNLRGGATQPYGELRTVVDISQCDHDETGLVTPAAPEGVADQYTIDEDTRLVVPDKGVLDNDIDLTGEPLVAHLVEGTSQGTLALDADGGFSFDPRGVFDHLDVGESATTSFSYLADDGALTSEPTTVTIRVVGRNDRPQAGPDEFVTDEDTALQVSPSGVLTNDTDAEGHPLTSVLVSGPQRGALTLRPDGGLRFDPGSAFQQLGATPGESETVTFRYVARDGTADSDEATVSVRVVGVNDAPIGSPDALVTDENTAIDIDPTVLVANDSDVEGQALTATGIALSGLGVGTLTPLPNGSLRYDPNADSADADGDPDLDHLASGETATVELTYIATDSGGLGSTPVTVTITVHGLSVPTANDDLRSTDEDHAITLDVLANDQARGGSLTLDTSETDGQATIEHDGVVRYDPSGAFDQLAAGAAGADSFRYTLTNDEGSSTGTVSIQVTGVNDAPRALDDSYTVIPGNVLEVPAPGVLGNDEDVDNPLTDLESVLVAPPDRGRLTLSPGGGFSFDPSGEFPGGGSTSFRYRGDDGLDESATATVTLQVFTNDSPNFQGDPYTFSAVVTDPPGTLIGTVVAVDGDGDPLTFTIADADASAFDLDPTSGELTIGAGGPPAEGDYTLLVDVSDGRGGTDRATVNVSVVPELNAVDDQYVAVGNTPLVGHATPPPPPAPDRAEVRVAGVLANDGGATGQVVPQLDLPTSQGGLVDLAADGSFVYTPPAAAPGVAGAWDGQSPLTDTFGYEIEGDGVADPSGEVTITLLPAIWYVDNQAAPGGEGTAWSPFGALSAISGDGADPDLAGQTIFLFGHADEAATTGVDESAYSGGIQLEDQQALVGQGTALTVINDGQQIPVVPSGPTPRVDGAADGTAIGLGTDNNLRGLTVGGEGAGIAGTDVGTLSAVVPSVDTAASPLHLTGSEDVDVRVDLVTADAPDAELALDGLGGSVALGTIKLRGAGPGGLSVALNAITGLVDIATAQLGDAGLSVAGTTAAGQVTVGSLAAGGADAGLQVSESLGMVSVASIDLTGVSGTGIGIADDDGTTVLGAGRVVGTPTAGEALLAVGGGSGGTVQVAADLTANASGSPCDAVLIQGVDAGGTVEVDGHVVGSGCGIRVDGATEPVLGTVRFLGGMAVQTDGAAAFHAADVAAPGRLEVLASLAGSQLDTDDSAVLQMERVRIGAAGMRINRADASFQQGLDPAAVGLTLTDISGEPGPGLMVNGGTVATPDLAGATITRSSLVTLRGLLVSQSANDGIVVRDSQGVTLDGLTIQQADGIGIDAARSGNLLVDGSSVVAAGSYGVQLVDLEGTTTIRGSSVTDGRDTQLNVVDGSTAGTTPDAVVIQSTVFSGGEPEDDSMAVLAGHDPAAATPSDLRLEVSGDTPTGTIGGDTGLSATAEGGATLDVALSRFVVADTADDAIALSADGSGSAVDFALNSINSASGGGIQLVGGAGVRVDAVNGGVAQGSMNKVAITSTRLSGVVLNGVTDVALGLVSVQAAEQHGIEVVNSSGVTLDQVDVTRPSRHGLSVLDTENLVVDDSRFDLRPPPSVPPTTPENLMPRFSSIRIQHLGGTANAVTDTTMRGSTGDQLTVLEGAIAPETSVPAGVPTEATIRLAGLTVLDTAVDPVIGRTSSTPAPVPDGNAVSVRAGTGAQLTVDLSGNGSTVDETILLQAEGGALSVTGGHVVEQVSRDSSAERDDSDPDPAVALVSTMASSTLDLALVGLDVVQEQADPGTPLPGSPVRIEAGNSGAVSGTVSDLAVTMAVPDGSTTTAPAVSVVARDAGTVTGLDFVGGAIEALGGPAVDLHTTYTEPPPTFPPTPPPPPGEITDVLVDGVVVASGLAHGFVVTDVECLSLLRNDTASVDGTGFVLDDVTLVDFTQATVAAWLVANSNLGPPAPRFESSNDVSPGGCS